MKLGTTAREKKITDCVFKPSPTAILCSIAPHNSPSSREHKKWCFSRTLGWDPGLNDPVLPADWRKVFPVYRADLAPGFLCSPCRRSLVLGIGDRKHRSPLPGRWRGCAPGELRWAPRLSADAQTSAAGCDRKRSCVSGSNDSVAIRYASGVSKKGDSPAQNPRHKQIGSKEIFYRPNNPHDGPRTPEDKCPTLDHRRTTEAVIDGLLLVNRQSWSPKATVGFSAIGLQAPISRSSNWIRSKQRCRSWAKPARMRY